MSGQRIVFHIGTPKSGTTYLQELLWESRPALLEAGVRYPGEGPADHFRATLEFHGNFHGWRDRAVDGAWQRLVTAAREHEGTTVISHELFGDLSEEAVARAMSDLEFAEVHVVVTARDLARQLPAVWQEDVKNRFWLPFEDFLAIVRPGSDRPDLIRGEHEDEYHGEAFWRRQDLPAVLRRWTTGLPADRVHLVTVPPSGADPQALWHRFASVLGVDPDVATLPSAERNRSLGRAETELIRRLNERLQYRIPWHVYGPRVTHYLAASQLPARPHSVRLTLPAGEQEWVSAHADAVVDQLAAMPLTVTGDLDDLRSPVTARAGYEPPTTEELLDAALDALAALIPTVPGRPPEPPPAPEPEPASGADASTDADAQAGEPVPGDTAADVASAVPAELSEAAADAPAPPRRRARAAGRRVARGLRRVTARRPRTEPEPGSEPGAE